ncbi:MAG TPA: threonine synthase [Gemmatimonadales bacterium]|nr:threonine synthase [Gemmatimonadales bacterium]
MTTWTLECSACDPVRTRDADGFPGVCEVCGAPYLVRYATLPSPELKSRLRGQRWTMWRYDMWLPLGDGEHPITLGEGGTPLLRTDRLGARHGLEQLWVKDESKNPTGSFKARGLAAAVTRAVRAGATSFVVPTAGNAGIALAAYATRAGVPARIYAPASTPRPILEQIRIFGGELMLIDGHIGDCGIAARLHAANTGAVDVSTLREPYRIEGKKTLGLELAEQLGWTLPDAIIYPTGGGTGLIGMWKAFGELRASGWLRGPLPRMYTVQATGCAPIVDAFAAGAERATPCLNPQTVAAGLRVPAPLGDRLMLQALRDSGGGAVAVSDEALSGAARELQTAEGIDASPEGGATLAAALELKQRGALKAGDRTVLFNTGAGWLYRT